MVLKTVAGARTGEDVDDLAGWVRQLEGSPEVTEVVALSCDRHEDGEATWSLVEADPVAGVARRRCLACAHVVPMLDSADRWTHPMTWACGGCGQSIAELVVGLSAPDGETVHWVALAARCVDCGRIAGLTDAVVPGLPLHEVRARL